MIGHPRWGQLVLIQLNQHDGTNGKRGGDTVLEKFFVAKKPDFSSSRYTIGSGAKK
jgi:hypothetical protein